MAGAIHSTWRLYDDKDLSVNDAVVLIDKVEPERPQTWRVIGRGRINKVIEKRMGDITEEDYEGHDPHESPEARLQAYKGYYGEQVTWDTPVKMVYFDFTPEGSEADSTAETDDDATTKTAPQQMIGRQVILYADGGSRGNPGPSAGGYVIMNADEEVLVDKGLYLGITTNNQAEYQALKAGLEEARRMGAREVDVRLDSLLVVNQMRGQFKVKNRELWPIHEAIKQLAGSFEKVTFRHVPRELNRLADAAVNRVLDEVDVSR